MQRQCESWQKESHLDPSVLMTMETLATSNPYLSNIGVTIQSKYHFDHIYIMVEKGIAIVHIRLKWVNNNQEFNNWAVKLWPGDGQLSYL